MKNKLIFTIHDFGLTQSVNDGIYYALNHRNGDIITQLSLLPNTSGSLDAARFARENTDIPVNLCFALTTSSPISKEVPSLIDNSGKFLKVNTKTWDFSILDKYNEDDIAKELEAQYNWFVHNIGRKPVSLTTQKNEHGDPKVLKHFVDIAKREGLPIQIPLWKWKSNYGAKAYADSFGVTMTDNVYVGIKDWNGKFGYDLEKDIDLLISDTSKNTGVNELIAFCGFIDKELFDSTSVSWQRGQIFNVLNNDAQVQKIRDNFDLISYKSLV